MLGLPMLGASIFGMSMLDVSIWATSSFGASMLAKAIIGVAFAVSLPAGGVAMPAASDGTASPLSSIFSCLPMEVPKSRCRIGNQHGYQCFNNITEISGEFPINGKPSVKVCQFMFLL